MNCGSGMTQSIALHTSWVRHKLVGGESVKCDLQVLSKPASAHESFQWLSRDEADLGLLRDMGAYLQVRTPHVTCACIQGKWD